MRVKKPKQTSGHFLPIKIAGSLLAMLLCGSVYAQPANDDCEDATVIPGSAPTPPYSDSVDASDATFDPADPLMSCNVVGDGTQTVWYKYTTDVSGTVAVNTFGSTTAGGGELDTVHAVYTGECGALVEVACFDVGLTDEGVGDVEAGVTYYVKVGQFADASDAGTVVLNVVEPPEPEQVVIESARDGVSAPISSIVGPLAPLSAAERQAIRERLIEVPNFVRDDSVPSIQNAGPVASGAPTSVAGSKPVTPGEPPNLVQIWEGGDNDDNAFTAGIILAPPDTDGDVGISHYVQMINVLTEIYDKSGNSVLGPFTSDVFFPGLGGLCENTNRGDPVVLYDEETDRWLVSQFAFDNAFSQFALCVAMSTTGDPTGSYFQYEFAFTGIGFPDYPKYGFATDAINVMANMFVPFQGAGVGAIDKAEAMSPGPATMVFFVLGTTEFGFRPGDNDGPVFDNTPPTFFTSNGGSGASRKTGTLGDAGEEQSS